MTTNFKAIMVNALNVKAKELEETAKGLVEESAEFGKEAMRENIRTRGTQKEWNKFYYREGIRRGASKPGRVWTGTMLEAVETQNRHEDGRSQTAFGWVEGDLYGYFSDQEYGFDHEDAGTMVPGMYSLSDAAEQTIEYAVDRFRKAFK